MSTPTKEETKDAVEWLSLEQAESGTTRVEVKHLRTILAALESANDQIAALSTVCAKQKEAIMAVRESEFGDNIEAIITQLEEALALTPADVADQLAAKDAEMKDWLEFSKAVTQRAMPPEMRMRQIWPNNWHQDCAFAAFTIHTADDQLANLQAELKAATASTSQHERRFMKTGAELIAEERTRQISEEGWTPEHDDGHDECQMAKAAACYALPSREMTTRKEEMDNARGCADPEELYTVKVRVPKLWPWDAEWWNPTPKNRVRELVKAGALIAAEIDRLQRDAARGKEAQ